MKYISILLIFISSVAFSQTGVKRYPRHYTGKGAPVTSSTAIFPGLGNGDSYMDTETKLTYRYSSTMVRWSLDTLIFPTGTGGKGEKGDKGDPGIDGTDGTDGYSPVVTVGVVSTLPAGSSAIVNDSDPGPDVTLNFGIPEGQQGPQGPPGSGSGTGGTGVWVTPYLHNDIGRINVYGYNSTATIQSAGVNPSVYSGFTVTSSDQFDWANLQQAIVLQYQTGKPIFLYLNFRGVNKDIIIKWDHYKLFIEGNGAWIHTSSTNVNYLFNREDATTATWQAMISNTKYFVNNLNIALQGTSVGFDLQMQNNSIFSNLLFQGGGSAMKANFSIHSKFMDIKMEHQSIGGIYVSSSEIAGVDVIGSASVGNEFVRIHFISFLSPQWALYLKHNLNPRIDGIKMEGCHLGKGIVIDGQNYVNFRAVIINNLYYEAGMNTNTCTTGGGGVYTDTSGNEAAIYVTTATGKITVNGVTGVEPAMLMAVKLQGGDVLEVTVRDVDGWNMLRGKMFYTGSTGPGVRYQFYNWNWWYYLNNMSGYFSGKSISKSSSSSANGQGTWTYYAE